MARLDQKIDRPANEAVGIERGLEVIDVKLNVERLEIKILLVAQRGDGVLLYRVEIFTDCIVRKFARIAFGDVDNVLAAITVFRKRRINRGAPRPFT